jgi:holliday junction DNA helicase RuvA
MIGYLKGTIIGRADKKLIVAVADVGYEVFVSSVMFDLSVPDTDIVLHIHTHVREDEISLYGFANRPELDFFKQLICVSGIGPKLAMGIVEVPVEKVKGAILAEDIRFLTQLPGLGKKTAGKMVLDLKSKVELSDLGPMSHRALDRDAVEALVNLGYDQGLVTKVLRDAPSDIIESEGLIRYFLQNA